MLTRYSESDSSTREATGNALTAALIVASGLLLYGAIAFSSAAQPTQAQSAQPRVEQVVVTAPAHVS